MTLVVDASVVVAALIDDGPTGAWAEDLIAGGDLVAPHLLPVEVANVLRRAECAARISRDVASLAHESLLQLPVALVPYEALGRRVWELRQSVMAYDAWYVALAEALGTGLATLDLRLVGAPGPSCQFVTPQT
ncbi:MAG: type II toxin-antitoxin system VapC family toxin [Chloroflexi bacterium]|nr:type II toxin-antitoxin system VapC family toxin [Chloroflexota bacterium]MDA1147163.1 type II toxin-antitoxin system VapC family toxin [Chloroflexota bacterium]